VDRYRNEPWFKKVVTHPYWDEMTPEGRLLTPGELSAALAARPGDFEIYRSASSFLDYTPLYQELSVPTLVIYGADDALVPIERSRAVVEPALKRAGTSHEIRVFEGADHSIQTPDNTVRPDYLTFMAAWAKRQLGANHRACRVGEGSLRSGADFLSAAAPGLLHRGRTELAQYRIRSERTRSCGLPELE
jgi:acetyl esterase/lipase